MTVWLPLKLLLGEAVWEGVGVSDGVCVMEHDKVPLGVCVKLCEGLCVWDRLGVALCVMVAVGVVLIVCV